MTKEQTRAGRTGRSHGAERALTATVRPLSRAETETSAFARERPTIDVETLAAALSDHLVRTSLKLVSSEGTDYISIPGHHHFAWPSQAKPLHVWPMRLHRAAQFYEETTTLLISYLIREFKIRRFIDAGAGRGYFSRVASSVTVNPPRTVAFEMRPDLAEDFVRMADNDRLRRLTTLVRGGLSEQHAGETTVWYARSRMYEEKPTPAEYREPWYLRLKHHLLGNRNRGLKSAQMLLTSIDHYCQEHGVHPGLIKIDVEGYEDRVLQGATETLEADRPFIVLELHRDKIQRFGSTRRSITGRLFDLGYKAIFLTDHHDRLACKVVVVDRDSRLIARQETDLILFVPG